MVAKRGGGESKVGLVIVLVFSLLANIGLGVGLYMYASADDSKDKKITELEKVKLKNMTDERNWYKFQALLFRTDLGYPPADKDAVAEMGNNKDNFDKGGFGTGQADLKEVTDTVKGLESDKVLGKWNAAQKRPTKTLKDVLADTGKEIETLKTNAARAEKDKADAEEKRATAEKALADAQEDMKKKYNDLVDKAKKDQTDDRDAITKLEKDLAQKGQELEKARTAADAEVKKLRGRSPRTRRRSPSRSR